jgi:hypothetical protein
MGCYTIPAND